MKKNGNKEYPDIFLAGTPKSGTTFLFDLLAQHPAISPSDPKEPFYHVDFENPYRSKKTDYRAFFRLPGMHMDGTSQTLYQKQVLQELIHLNEKPYVLVALRDPAERVLSSFQFTSHNLAAVKSSLTFDRYVEILLSGSTNELHPYCSNQEAFFSLSQELVYSHYYAHLEAWRQVVGEGNLKVIVFEWLKQNIDSEMREILGFLGLPEMFDFNLENVERNSSQGIRNRDLHFFLRSIYRQLGYRIPFKNLVKSIYGFFQHEVASKENHEEPMRRLRAHFQPHNRKLSQDFGLDLSSWQM